MSTELIKKILYLMAFSGLIFISFSTNNFESLGSEKLNFESLTFYEIKSANFEVSPTLNEKAEDSTSDSLDLFSESTLFFSALLHSIFYPIHARINTGRNSVSSQSRPPDLML